MAAFALILSGCAAQGGGAVAGGVAGTLARLEPLEAACHGKALNGYFALDLDNRDRGPELQAAHLAQLRALGNQVAACGGHLKAVAFGLDAADSPVLAEGSFPTKFGTDTARLIRAQDLINSFMDQVRNNLPTALRAINPAGNDVIAQLVLAGQYQAQRGTGRLYVELATSGIATLGPVPMDTKAFTRSVARAAGQRVPVPNLTAATVRFVDIGSTSTAPLSTGLTWNLTDFYQTACRRTGASCSVTTDYTANGG